MHSLTAYSFLAECGRSRKRFAFFVVTPGCIALAGSATGYRSGISGSRADQRHGLQLCPRERGCDFTSGGYFEHDKRSWRRLHERREGSEVPCHHNLEAYLEAWIEAAGIAGDKKVRSARATN